MAPSNNSTNSKDNQLGLAHSLLISLSAITVLTVVVLVALWQKKYRTLVRTIQDLREAMALVNIPTPDPPVEKSALELNVAWEKMDDCMEIGARPLEVHSLEEQRPDIPLRNPGKEDFSESPLQKNKCKPVSRLPWKPTQQGSRFTKADLNLLQLIKAGKEGVFYKARMSRGTCKGHSMFTCKIAKEGVTPKRVDMEVSIMRKLVHHKNVLQLLDWNTAEEPYLLLMEFVSYGTLRSFLQTHRDQLIGNPELQSLLTLASYQISLAMEHLRSKMVVHCDLALRNIMVSRFPWEVKVAEFGLARDLTRMRSRNSARRKRERVPLRWYPPEYFRNNYFGFKGDVWAFGIVLWEMQTFGTLPYPNLETSEAVVCHICAGHKNSDPDGCRPEILQIIHDCWMEPYTSRPSFTDIVRILENIIENDADYVDVFSPAMASAKD